MRSSALYSEALEQFQQAVLEGSKKPETQRLLKDFLLDGRSNFATPDAAKEAAKSLATEAGHKYSGLRIGKTEVVPKKWVDNVLENINNIVAVGSFMTKDAPESIGVAWFAVSLTLKAISNNYSLYALFGAGLTDITEIMIILVHYDQLYDERGQSDFKTNNLVDKLFRDTISAYAAVLDFSFSVKQHLSASGLDKVVHVFKDFFNTTAPQFQSKLSSIAKLKAKVLEGSQAAFQDKNLQHAKQAQEAIDQILQHQSQMYELQLAQNQMLDSLRDDFKDFKDSVKRKTPMDYLKEEFFANTKRLLPLPPARKHIEQLLDQRHKGTGLWILRDDQYQNWATSKSPKIICITGGLGTGKSIIVASLVEHFEKSSESEAIFVNYVSCLEDVGSSPIDSQGRNANRICNTLLYQMYSLAVTGDEDLHLLETCNKIFRNLKKEKAGQIPGRGEQGDGLPEFTEAMSKLLILLQRRTVLVIESVSSLDENDQVEILNNLQNLLREGQETGSKLSIIVEGRSDSVFIQRCWNNFPIINVDDCNMEDIEILLSSRLEELPGWTEAEKRQAKETVINKAGSRFGFIDKVAMPYLKQPFQRPIGRYLEHLPEGMNESFEDSIRSMPRNYFDLLELAVTWCLVAPSPPTVKEVIEAYSGTYTVGEVNDGLSSGMEHIYVSEASQLEISQLMTAGGAFLSTNERNAQGNSFVRLQNATQVKNFCERSIDSHYTDQKDSHHLCDGCRRNLTSIPSLHVDLKMAHFKIALMALKHLNSPLFQKRFRLIETRKANNDTGGHLVDNADQTEHSGLLQDDAVAKTPDRTLLSAEGPSKLEVVPQSTQPDSGKEENEPPEYVLGDRSSNSDSSDYEADIDETESKYTELSIDDDFDQKDWLKYETDNEASNSSFYFKDPDLRYEIDMWPYHLREAERLWSVEQRKTTREWERLNQEVYDEILKFVCNHSAFHAWQRMWGDSRKGLRPIPHRPLHLTAYLGLGTLTERLLKEGADIHELCRDRSVFYYASFHADAHQNFDMLQILLQHGADPYDSGPGQALAPIQSWILNDAGLPVIRVLVENGVSLDTKDRSGWTSLHAFAWNGNDVEAFQLLMNPTDKSKIPDINVVDRDNETALHRLLWRRDVPLDLLKAFLAVEGIDVNRDDRDSQQPLSVASTWGSLNVVRLLLEAKADTKDDDNLGQVALHKAAQGDHAKCIRLLVDAGSEVDAKDKGGSTPLQHAAYHGRTLAVKTLLEKGAHINSTNHHKRTPFFNATLCLYGGEETAELILYELKQRGYRAGDINVITTGRRTPLRQAAAHGFYAVLEELLQDLSASDQGNLQATINLKCERLERGPLHCAVLRGSPECVKILLEYGADVKSRDSGEKTPLTHAVELWAVRNEKTIEDIVLSLIEADTDAATQNVELPSVAAANGSLQVLQKLHELGADMNVPDSHGWTPIAHAKSMGHTASEQFLKHRTARTESLPRKWWSTAFGPVVDDDGLRVTYDGRVSCIGTEKPLPPSAERFYFEVTVDHVIASGLVAIGLSTHDSEELMFPGVPKERPGSSVLSWGYYGYDGCLYLNGETVSKEMIYGPGDTVGCGVDLELCKIWFTRNGEKLDFEFGNVRGRLFPVLGLENKINISTNFGTKPFKWREGKPDDGKHDG